MSSFNKRISQETFDDVIRENIEDFEMSRDDAIREAIQQFQKQGIDLSNIDVTGGLGRQELLDVLQRISSLSIPCVEDTEALALLNELKVLCDKQHPCIKRNILLLQEEGGINSLYWHVSAQECPTVAVATLQFLADLSYSHESVRDMFEPGGSDRLCTLLQSFMPFSETSTANYPVIAAALNLCKIVARSENNKNSLMKASLGNVVSDIVSLASNVSGESLASLADIIEKSCYVIRELCTFNDYRSEMSCAHENGKVFLKQNKLVSQLVQLSSGYKQFPEVSASTLLAIRALVTTNEAVQVICTHGIIELLSPILLEFHSSNLSVKLIRAAISLIRNIAADDIRKDMLVGMGVIDPMVAIMSTDPYNQDASLVEHVFGSFAQFSLRSPGSSFKIVSSGASVEIMVQCMRKFADNEKLQRQASLTFRNIAGRCPELRNVLLDAGVEHVLRAAGRLPSAVDEAYSALRDLGCDVQYVRVNADGTIAPAFEQFGANPKLNFRPIYDEADDMEERMVNESRAPFSSNSAQSGPHRHAHGLDDDDDDFDDHSHRHDHVHDENCKH